MKYNFLAPRNIYLYDSKKVHNLARTPIERKVGEHLLKVLVVSNEGNRQILVNFKLPNHVNGTVQDVYNKLTPVFAESIIEDVFSVDDFVYNVKYVITARLKPEILHKEKNVHYINESIDNIVNTSCSKQHSNMNDGYLSADTEYLTADLKRNVEIVTSYPPHPSKGSIIITTEDFKCLDKNVYLNDTIIDFYLKYLTIQLLSENDNKRVHIFDSYFFTRLTRPGLHATSSSQYEGVSKWTKNVNIFEKEFIFVPINRDKHWFLAIAWYPGCPKNGNTQAGCLFIMIFNSMPSVTKNKSRIEMTLKNYFKSEYNSKVKVGSIDNRIKVFHPQVPHQYNGSDCGVYLLQFVESFLKDFVMARRLKHSVKSLRNWFTHEIIKEKRKELKKLIVRLSHRTQMENVKTKPKR